MPASRTACVVKVTKSLEEMNWMEYGRLTTQRTGGMTGDQVSTNNGPGTFEYKKLRDISKLILVHYQGTTKKKVASSPNRTRDLRITSATLYH